MTDISLDKDGLTLRTVSGDDEEMLFNWRNLDEIVRLSYSQRKVARSEHHAWFERILTDDDTLLFIILDLSGEPIGQLRFDRKGDSKTAITIFFLPGEQGKGRGSRVIDGGCKYMKQLWPDIRRVEATIQATNYPSQAAFSRAGFKLVSDVKAPDNDCYILCLGC